MDYSGFSNDDLRLEIEAIELALNAPNSRPFDGSEARLQQKLQAAKTEQEKRDAAVVKARSAPPTGSTMPSLSPRSPLA